MKLVVAEKPSVAQSLAAVLAQRRKRTGIWKAAAGWCPGAWAIWWSWPSGSLWGAVRQMAVCGSSYPSRPLEI